MSSDWSCVDPTPQAIRARLTATVLVVFVTLTIQRLPLDGYIPVPESKDTSQQPFPGCLHLQMP